MFVPPKRFWKVVVIEYPFGFMLVLTGMLESPIVGLVFSHLSAMHTATSLADLLLVRSRLGVC